MAKKNTKISAVPDKQKSDFDFLVNGEFPQRSLDSTYFHDQGLPVLPQTVAPKCIFRHDDGTRCNAYAMKNQRYCWTHSPEVNEDEKRAASSRGGKARWQYVAKTFRPLGLATAEDVVVLLQDTLNEMRSGEISPKFAASTAYLSYAVVNAIRVVQKQKNRAARLALKRKPNSIEPEHKNGTKLLPENKLKKLSKPLNLTANSARRELGDGKSQ